jgi:microcystin-dependent protein
VADPQTSNILLNRPTRGSDAGTWDAPLNFNSDSIDGRFAGATTIGVSNAPVLLTSPTPTNPPVVPGQGPTQAENAILKVSGTLTADVTMTLPLAGYYIVDTTALVPGTFVAFARAVGNGEIVGLQPGCAFHIYCDGTDVRYVDLQPVGTYLDIGATVVPRWISGSTKAPFLNCDGSAVDGAKYPALRSMMATLPDFRGVSPAYLNQGTGRIPASSGPNGDTIFSIGGAALVALTAAQIPQITSNVQVNVSGNSTRNDIPTGQSASPVGAGALVPAFNGFGGVAFTGSGTGAAQSNNTGGAAHINMQPTTIAGLRLIRAG